MATLNLDYQGGGDFMVDRASEAVAEDVLSHGYSAAAGGGGGGGTSSIFSQAGPAGRPHDDLKQMLESSKDGLKSEAMKRLVVMMAKGRSSDAAARELFPSVVKNVVTKNAELKKLVYLYLTRYAEQEPDLALLSISSFQRSLKDPNPLIRGCALRVLSSIRVPMIAPIVLVAIRDCAGDMSPYVRKTAAHAIPKLFGLDAELKGEIVAIVEKLLSDKTSLVLGSAVAAFEEVCPERSDLVHAHFRKFASLMADFDEWGQVILLNMLVRYGRSQFADPARSGNSVCDSDHRMLLRNSKPLLQSRNAAVVMAVVQLHLALGPAAELNGAIVKPLVRLLHSRPEIQALVLANIATLTATSSYHLVIVMGHQQPVGPAGPLRAPPEELLRQGEGHHGGQVAQAAHPDQPGHLGQHRAHPARVPGLHPEPPPPRRRRRRRRGRRPPVHRGHHPGHRPVRLPHPRGGPGVSERPDRAAVQRQPGHRGPEHHRGPHPDHGQGAQPAEERTRRRSRERPRRRGEEEEGGGKMVSLIIRQLARLMDRVGAPQARATILWILGEFCGRNATAYRLAPDTLRKLAKSFAAESDLVKLQTMNLAAKLWVASHPDLAPDSGTAAAALDRQGRLKLLVHYVFQLAKYDVSYDVRDRARFLRQLLARADDEEEGGAGLEGLKLARKVLLSAKASTASPSAGSASGNHHLQSGFRVGTLSHFVGHQVAGYCPLSPFPEVPPDASVRQGAASPTDRGDSPEPLPSSRKPGKPSSPASNGAESSFYTESSGDEEEEESGEEDEEEEGEEEESGEDEEEETEDESTASEDSSSEEEEEEKKVVVARKPVAPTPPPPPAVSRTKKGAASREKGSPPVASSVDMLLDFDVPASETSAAVLATFLTTTPTAAASGAYNASGYRVSEYAEQLPSAQDTELLTLASKSLRFVYRFPRVRDGPFTTVEVVATNWAPLGGGGGDQEPAVTFGLRSESAPGTVKFTGYPDDQQVVNIEVPCGQSRLVTLAVDFKESPSQAVQLAVDGNSSLKLLAPIGELLLPVKFASAAAFDLQVAQLRGMNEVCDTIPTADSAAAATTTDWERLVTDSVLGLCNMATNVFPQEETEKEERLVRFAASTAPEQGCLVLVTYSWRQEQGVVSQRVNCERMVLGSLMARTLKEHVAKTLKP
ncbi:AP-3 complex subunit beta-2 [Halotydeus destructor]|nr:AP-3 complex subunit beta-2 [Halotydeus destructor]